MKEMAAVILAAGQGVRMHSDIPKVLHNAAGKPLLSWVAKSAQAAGLSPICLVVGHHAEQVIAAMPKGYLFGLQEEQLGTAHALRQGITAFDELPKTIMVLCGDTPLLRAETLNELKAYFNNSGAACTVMTTVLETGGNYGRIIRGADDTLTAIVEAKEANNEQLQIREINSGVYCFDVAALTSVIDDIDSNNTQGEYYLTDIVKAMNSRGLKVNAFICQDGEEIMGVNDRVQLAEAIRILYQRKNRELMLSGITMVDPGSVYIDAEVMIGPDTLIEPNVYISGQTTIGSGCKIGPQVKIADSVIGAECVIGPFAYIRPGSVLADRVKAGHFVEIKKSSIGRSSKVPHLSYIGDAIIGECVNVGCGTITCNYDGVDKHTTQIDDNAFIGSNVNLIPPIKVGKNSTVAAGSTITSDVPENSLALARASQINKEGWALTKDPRRKKKK